MRGRRAGKNPKNLLALRRVTGILLGCRGVLRKPRFKGEGRTFMLSTVAADVDFIEKLRLRRWARAALCPTGPQRERTWHLSCSTKCTKKITSWQRRKPSLLAPDQTFLIGHNTKPPVLSTGVCAFPGNCWRTAGASGYTRGNVASLPPARPAWPVLSAPFGCRLGITSGNGGFAACFLLATMLNRHGPAHAEPTRVRMMNDLQFDVVGYGRYRLRLADRLRRWRDRGWPGLPWTVSSASFWLYPSGGARLVGGRVLRPAIRGTS